MEELIQSTKMKIPDKDTKFFFSISNNPSLRGSNFYNKLFFKKKKNNIYFPILIKNNLDFKKFIDFLRLGIIKVGGMSISMPFKSYALKFANIKHKSTIISKNINTLIFKKKKIYAYNSDFLAAEKIFKKKKFDNFIIMGAGSLALSFINLLRGKKIFIFNRSKKNIKEIILKYKNVFELNQKNSKKLKNICIINATPKHNHKKLLNLVDFNRVKYICDCIIEKESKLSKISKRYFIKYTNGDYFYECQRSYQQKIYLNEKL